MSTVAGHHLEEIAQELFEVLTKLALFTHSHQRRGMELKEFEFLTLSVLHAHQTMIVGHIQKLLGILPAQMSRIIRSLENRQPPLIECQINPQDKRKVNVCLTPAGERARHEYQEARVQKIIQMLKKVPEDDHEDLSRLVVKLNELLGSSLPKG